MGKAKDWSNFISEESKARQPSPLKALANFLSTPGLISLGGGLPNPGYFPFEYVDVRVPSMGKFDESQITVEGTTIRVIKNKNHIPTAQNGTDGKGTTGVNSGEVIVSEKTETDLATTLQYAQGFGDIAMRQWAKEHIAMVHNPPYENWDLTLSIGNTLAYEACLRTLCNKGDSIIMEEYAYTSSIFATRSQFSVSPFKATSCVLVLMGRPQGVKIVGIGTDGNGMRADLLDQKLTNWDANDGRKPRVAYIVPTGQNPTGASMFLERRKELYSVFQNHDILIIEDDPYYFLQMEPYTGEITKSTSMTGKELLSSLIPSFLSLDTDGRVIRLDSFSKILAPGLRLGFITASSQLIERLTRCIEVTSQAPSGFSQSIAYQLLSTHWGHAGFLDWLVYMRGEYTQRRDVCCRAIEKYLPKEVVKFTVPAAGMFFWVQIKPTRSGNRENRFEGERGLGERVFKKCVEEGVLLVPGDVFKADLEADDGGIYFRGTFAAVPFDKLEIGIQRFGKALREIFGLHTQV